MYFGTGFIDIQVNGASGVDINDPNNLNAEGIRKICWHQWEQGVAKWYPTIITGPDKEIVAILEIIADARKQDDLIESSIPGVHLEIWVSPEAKGCHNERFFRNPDWSFVKGLKPELRKLIKIVTIAPELDGAKEFIQTAFQNGVRVGIGHTMADYKTIQIACEMGASFSTHLGNGIPGLLNRTDNPIWSQLSLPMAASFIADGFHVKGPCLKSMINLKGTHNSIIVTDSIFATGLEDGDYELRGNSIRVKDGKSFLPYSPDVLAGSVTTMLKEFSFLSRCGFCYKETMDMMSKSPASLLGISSEMSSCPLYIDIKGSEAKVVSLSIDGKKVV